MINTYISSSFNDATKLSELRITGDCPTDKLVIEIPTEFLCGVSGSVTSSADVDGLYVVYATDADLPNSKVLTAGSNITLANGPGIITVSFDDSAINNQISNLSASVTASFISASNSLTQVSSSIVSTVSIFSSSVVSSFLSTSNALTVTSQSINNSIVSSSTVVNNRFQSPFVTIGNTTELPNERALTAGQAITITDGGVGSTVTVAVQSIFSQSLVETIQRITNLSASITASFISASNNLTQVSSSFVSTISIFSSSVVNSFLSSSNALTVTSQSINNSIVSGSTVVNNLRTPLFVTLASTTELPNERVLTAGSGIAITDNGAGSTVLISSTGAGSADVSASYVVIGLTGSLPNERALTAGQAVTITDGGAGSSITVGVQTVFSQSLVNIIQTVSNFSASVTASFLSASNSITLTSQSINSSITNLRTPTFLTLGATSELPNERVLTAGSGIAFTDGGAGNNLLITATGGTSADVSASYVLIGVTGSLPNDRALTAGQAITITDGGAGSTVTVALQTVFSQSLVNTIQTLSNLSASITASFLSSSNSITQVSSSFVSTISIFSSSVVNSFVSSSDVITNLRTPQFLTLASTSELPNERVLTAGSGIALTDNGAGNSLLITATGATSADVSASYIVVGITGSLPNERSLSAGQSITITDGGAGSTISVGIQSAFSQSVVNIIQTVSNLSASITASFISASNSITVTSQSINNSIVSGTTVVNNLRTPQFITLASTTELANERILTAGSGITLTDGGAGSTISVGIQSTFSQSVVNIIQSVSNISASITASFISSSTSLTQVSSSFVSTLTSAAGTVKGLQVSAAGSARTIDLTGLEQGENLRIGGFSGSTVIAGTYSDVVIANNVKLIDIAPSGGNVTFTGFAAVGGNTGCFFVLAKFGTGGNVIIAHNTTSAAGNRIFTPNGVNYVLENQLDMVLIWYFSGRWQVVSRLVPLSGISSQADDTFLATIGGAGSPGAVPLTTLAGGGLTGGADAILNVGAGTGIIVNTNDVAINNNVVATISGSTFSGVVNAPFLSGSLQRTTAGLSYIVGAGATTVTSASNGQITVSSTTGSLDLAAAYVWTGQHTFTGSTSFAVGPTSDVSVASVTGGLWLSAGHIPVVSPSVTNGDVLINAAGGAVLAATATKITTATDSQVAISADDSIRLLTNGVERLEIEVDGAWQLAGNAGTAGQVMVSAGASAPPAWGDQSVDESISGYLQTGIGFRKSRKQYWFSDDFTNCSVAGAVGGGYIHSDEGLWTCLPGGAAAGFNVVPQAPQNGHPGIWRLTTLGVNGNNLTLHKGATFASNMCFPQDFRKIEAIILAAAVSTTTWELGLTDSAENNGIYFYFSAPTDTTIHAYCEASGTGTDVDTNFTWSPSDWITLRIEQETAGTILYYINDNLVATISTNVPTTQPVNFFIRVTTGTAATRSLDVDYVLFESNDLGTRDT